MSDVFNVMDLEAEIARLKAKCEDCIYPKIVSGNELDKFKARAEKAEAIIEAIEDWAVVDFNESLLGFIKQLKAEPDAVREAGKDGKK